MTRTLYLHIGAHRTATKSIQRFLARNFDAMVENGCLLPFRKPRHFEMMNKLLNGSWDVSDAAADMDRRADSKTVEITKLIVTDEDVCMRPDLSVLAQFQKHYDVKIVYSMRRQDLWLESWYFQNIKWQWNPSLSHITFDEFLDRREEFHWIHYDRYVRHLEDVFGAENILLNVFEKEQMPDGPVHAFCRQVGLEALIGSTPDPHVNFSMSAAMVEFARHMPMDEFTVPERELLRQALEQVDRTCLGHTGKQSERLIAPAPRRAILSEYQEGNTAIARRYWGRDALFLAPLPAEDAPLAQMKIPEDSTALMEKFVAPLFRQLILNGVISKPEKMVPAKPAAKPATKPGPAK